MLPFPGLWMRHLLATPCYISTTKLRYLGMDEGMSHLYKLWQTYMLAALNTKEAYSKEKCDKHDNIPEFKMGDLIMVKKICQKSNWDAKYVPNFRLIKLIGMRQLEVSNPTGRLWMVNISDVHKILSADFVVSCIPDEQVFARKSKYINNPCILKEVFAIDAFLHEHFPDVRLRHQ